MYKEGQRILERQRFQFPAGWRHSDNIEGEWSAFNDILRRKHDSIQTQVHSEHSRHTARLFMQLALSVTYTSLWFACRMPVCR